MNGPKTPYSWLLFDADDTIFDYPQAENKALRESFLYFGQMYSTDYLRLYQAINRQIWRDFENGLISAADLRLKRFRLLFEEIGLTLDPQDFSQRYLENLALAYDLLPGAFELLQELSKVYKLALVTNGLGEVQHSRLQHSTIRPFIQKMFISEEIGVAKPDPAFFRAVFAGIGNPPRQEVLIIGDSLTSDMKGGIDFGIDTCWFNQKRETTNLALKYEIKDLGELRALLT